MTRNSRVLLGITGSVAAVKGPELCLHLLRQGFDVKVLLTHGGSNFWNKAQYYDPTSWQELQEKVKAGQAVIHCKRSKNEVLYAVQDIVMSHPRTFKKFQTTSGRVGVEWAILCYMLSCEIGRT